MSTTDSPLVFIDAAEFANIVNVGLIYGFPDKYWWMHSRTTRLAAKDLADPWTMLPVVAFMAEEVWEFLGPATDSVFEPRFYPDERAQYGFSLSAVAATSRMVAGRAVIAALCLADLPAGNLDPVLSAFIRSQEQRERQLEHGG